MAHECGWPGCKKETDLWGCREHWYRLPPQLRQRLMKEYVGGRVFKTAEYNGVIKEIEQFIATHGGKV